MTKREPITSSTCRTCGLCCVAPHEQDAFVELEPEDLLRLPASFRHKVRCPEHQVRSIATASEAERLCQSALATKFVQIRRGPLAGARATVCVALRGQPAARVSCAIYDKRPAICRSALKPGDRTCREIRSEYLDLNPWTQPTPS